ncbi:MAG TPA: SMC-Scp complex subunit ScpB [Verrucomicrobiae bacterium]|nr:SMC-Scp complex subunit ScpB [Verrucomicrobiae bacterium]
MDLKFILESILFSAQQPLTPKELRDLLADAAEHDESGAARPFKKTPIENIEAALGELERDHAAAERSYRLVCVAGAWQFASQPEFAPWIRALVGHRNRPSRLSAPALETLAIIAYRQPITRAEIEQVRGVAVDGVMQTLLERGLVEQVGRADVVGRPMTYGTTSAFLEYFGLKVLDDLPAADELRRIPVTKPESLLTVDPGLATAPPQQLKLPVEGGRPAPHGNDAAPASMGGESPRPPAGERAHSNEASAAKAGVATAQAESPARMDDVSQASIELAQGAEQVSPVESELPQTTGTASNAALQAQVPSTQTTGTASAEPPPKHRLTRRKKDTGSEN